MLSGGVSASPAHATADSATRPIRIPTRIDRTGSRLFHRQVRGFHRGQHLGRLEEVERAVHHLDVLDGARLVDDEVRAFGIPIHGARLVRFHRPVCREHLTAEVREEELLGVLVFLPRGEGEVVIRADAHDLGARGLELRQCCLEAGEFTGSRGGERGDEGIDDDGLLGRQVRELDGLAVDPVEGEVGRLLPDIQGGGGTGQDQDGQGAQDESPAHGACGRHSSSFGSELLTRILLVTLVAVARFRRRRTPRMYASLPGLMASSRRSFLAGGASLTAALLLPRGAASQPAPARPLVPRETFFGDPDVTSAQLSFDGAWVAYIAPVDGVRNLWLAPVADLAAARPLTRVTDRPIGSFFQWAYTNRHVVFWQERDGDENWRASSVDIGDGTIMPLTPPRGVRSWLQEVSRRFPREMLVLHNERDKRLFDLFRIDVVVGQL